MPQEPEAYAALRKCSALTAFFQYTNFVVKIPVKPHSWNGAAVASLFENVRREPFTRIERRWNQPSERHPGRSGLFNFA